MCSKRFGGVADAARDALVKWYGEQAGRAVRTAETVSISEYGRMPSEEELRELFPFFSG